MSALQSPPADVESARIAAIHAYNVAIGRAAGLAQPVLLRREMGEVRHRAEHVASSAEATEIWLQAERKWRAFDPNPAAAPASDPMAEAIAQRDAVALVRRLASNGITLRAEGDKLVACPGALLLALDRSDLAKHRARLLGILQTVETF